MGQGPLAGLRVIDLTDDTGRFATKLLAEAGASVTRIGRGSAGPAMLNAELARRGGLLDWWYDGGKRRLSVDLDTDAGRETYRRLASRADLVLDTEPPGRLASLGLDHATLTNDNPSLVQVSLTPFGLTGPRAHWQTSDLVAGALGGVLSVSGTADRPVGAWGRQNLHFGSLMATVCGLAGVYSARETGRGQHVDLSLHETVATTIEQIFFQHWFDDILTPMFGMPKRALRQGSLHWLGAYVVTPARTGACMITTAPSPLPFLEWMAEEGDPEGIALSGLTIEAAIPQMGRVMAAFKRFARTKDSGELFQRAQDLHIAFGEVQTVAQVAANPQYEFRGTFRPVADAPGVRLPGPFADFHGTPAPPPEPPAAVEADLDSVLAEWGAPSTHAANGTSRSGPFSSGKPLEGVRIVDFTWVLAGPFGCRMLGDLGADVLKFQTAERATLVNSPDFPYFYVWNRSKRSATLNMKHDQALAIIRRIIEQSDVLIENFSAGVLDRWGIGYETVKEWNPGIIYVTMSGAGHQGPWSKMITYAPTIHALCGLTHLTNPPDRRDVGPGFSLNDHAAGFIGTIAVLSALESRRATGVGQHVDIAQMETGTYILGPALLDYFANGREAQPNGNVDPFGEHVPNEVFRAGDQSEVAITCRNDDEWQRLCTVIGPLIAHLAADDECATAAGRMARLAEVNAAVAEWVQSRIGAVAVEALQAVGVPAGLVQDGEALMNDPQLVARNLWRSNDHQVFGERPYDRFPALWSGTDLEPYLLSPGYLGEHNFDIFTELGGMSEEEIAIGMGDELFG
jgi:crotonobetainyl-CoA:carnitine CoA-transferase CaiB-like acyl-CoA transferase